MISLSDNALAPRKSLCKAIGGQPGNFFCTKIFKSATVESLGIESFFFLSRNTDPTEVEITIEQFSVGGLSFIVSIMSVDASIREPHLSLITFCKVVLDDKYLFKAFLETAFLVIGLECGR